MKINFYNPFHHIVEKFKAQDDMQDAEDISYVLTNRRPGQSLLYYKDGTSKYVSNRLGEKMLKLIDKRNK